MVRRPCSRPLAVSGKVAEALANALSGCSVAERLRRPVASFGHRSCMPSNSVKHSGKSSTGTMKVLRAARPMVIFARAAKVRSSTIRLAWINATRSTLAMPPRHPLAKQVPASARRGGQKRGAAVFADQPRGPAGRSGAVGEVHTLGAA